MKPIFYVLILSVFGGIATLVEKLRIERFQNGPKAQEMEEKLREFEKQALAADETLVLSDYSPRQKTFVVLSDGKIHGCRQKRNTSECFDIAYADVKKCRLMDIMGNKVELNGDVMNIYLKTYAGKAYTLIAFPKATQIAHELDAHGLLKSRRSGK